MALVDFHCHLDLYPDPHAVAAEAARLGVYVLSVTTTPSAFQGTVELAPAGSRIRTALGLHPELAAARKAELDLFEKLLPLTDYVGEVGLDGSRPHQGTLDQQGEILSAILGLCAQEGGKTLSLHSRGATKLLLDILEMEPLAGRSVLHWFTGSQQDIARASDMGCWFSVGSPMLYSAAGKRAVSRMPIERILPETDGPFGMIDGEPLYPWQAMDVVGELSKLLAIPSSDLAKMLTDNFQRLTSASIRQSAAVRA